MSIGALVPDLDREYFFVAKEFIGRHQLHRSLFHNFFFIGALYFVNPFLSLGALSHSLLDMFTSATDRGSEVFFPLTRIIRPFYYDIKGAKPSQPRGVEWWVEDPWRLLKNTTDRDLQEPGEQPWKRSYGPFKNSRIVDWGIFFGSLLFLVISRIAAGQSMFSMSGFRTLSLVSLGGFAIFYGLGEWWRRHIAANKPRDADPIILALMVVGVVTFLIGGYFILSPPRGIPNLNAVWYALLAGVLGFGISYFFVRLRKAKYEDMAL